MPSHCKVPSMKPTPQAHEEAKRHPNGYVYVLDGAFMPHEAVPPERIVGAWRVNAFGLITGSFLPNPNYKKSN